MFLLEENRKTCSLSNVQKFTVLRRIKIVNRHWQTFGGQISSVAVD